MNISDASVIIECAHITQRLQGSSFYQNVPEGSHVRFHVGEILCLNSISRSVSHPVGL
jgi:hypothetical protein